MKLPPSDGPACYLVAAHDVMILQFLGSLEPGGVVEHIRHPSQREGILFHSDRNVFFLLWRQVFVVVEDDLEEAVDNVQWCPYLVRHILQEGHLLLTCRLCQVISALQLVVALLGLLVGLLQTGDLFCQRLLHGGETVL